jgi:glycosyltransferase involved in cell wall biosynthesis
MKIIQILPELNAGGVERGTLEIAAHLVREGHESLVISNGGRQVADLEKAGSRHIQMPVHRKALASLGQIPRLRKLFATEKPDIIHLRSRLPAWLAWLAWKSLPRNTRPRLVTTVHGFYSVNAYSAVMTKGERVIAVSESIRDYITDNYPDTPAGKISVVHRGVDPELFPRGFQPDEAWREKWSAEQPQLAGKKVLLLPGRITRLKGHGDFFRLLAALKKQGRTVHGLIAGDAHPKKLDYLAELKTLLAEMGLVDHVTFLGHRSDVREIMAVSDVVCALSQQPESFGRTVLEAMAIGKPVLGYDCGGVGELLSTVFPAGKVPLGDAARLLEKAVRILDESPEPKVPEGAFTLGAMCGNTLALYADLLKSPGRLSG